MKIQLFSFMMITFILALHSVSSANTDAAQASQAASAESSALAAINELSTMLGQTQTKAKVHMSNAAAMSSTNPPGAADEKKQATIEEKNAATLKALGASAESCATAGKLAKVCLAQFSPQIQTGLGLIGTILTGFQNMQNMSSAEACQKQNKAMDVATKAITAYNVACSAAQANCFSSCESFSKELQAAKSQGIPQLASVEMKIEPQKVLCESYKLNMSAAMAGIMSMMTQSAKMSQCKENTTVADCAKDPYNPACAKGIDCSKTENFQMTQCICQRSPTAAGCPGYAGTQNTPSGSNTPALSGRSANDGTLGLNTNSDIPVGTMNNNGTSGSTTTAGVGSGAGSGLSGGQNGFAVGSATKAASADGKKEKGLNANILGGFDGGGGGGGSASRGTASSLTENSAYKAYMPGGSKDPTATTKTYGGGQVTGAGSKSNWEKVTERYLENKSSLVGQ